MRFHGFIAGGLLLCASCVLSAQRTAKPVHLRQPLAQAPQPTVGTNLLDLDDGLAILGAALETRHKVEPRSDCSHLVHAIYEKAGFPYQYQASRDIYAGAAPGFRRVTQPQPGDLIVWPGHAGVVVSPAQRTFYSSLRSGFGVQPYDSYYWKGRGRPRFFRYVKGSLPAPPLQAAASRTPTLKPTGFRPDAENPRTANIADKTEKQFGPPMDPDQSALAVPVTVTVNSARPKPDQVRVALDQQFRTAGEALQSRNILALYPALVAFDRLEIQNVQLKGDRGWAQVTIRGAVLVAGADKRPKKKAEMERWNLRRVSNDAWELVLPAEITYIPREIAVHILAQQLAALTDEASDSHTNGDQKTQLARWLNILLD
jgi:hypothetical protein